VTGKEQLIIDLWTGLGKESVGAADLDLIQQTLLERLGTQGRESPASIARTLADHGARLQHPEILETDVRWREREVLAGFLSEELNFQTIEAAAEWIERLGALGPQPELRRFVMEVKTELELFASSKRVSQSERDIAAEVAHWLTVWLQNPPIFADWLTLRRQSPEFRERFRR
jgi:hypothetical protein